MQMDVDKPVVTVRRHPDGRRTCVGWAARGFFQLTIHSDEGDAISAARRISRDGEVAVGRLHAAKPPYQLGIPSTKSIEAALRVADELLQDVLARPRKEVK